jgi:hypothetical protein
MPAQRATPVRVDGENRPGAGLTLPGGNERLPLMPGLVMSVVRPEPHRYSETIMRERVNARGAVKEMPLPHRAARTR